MAQFPWFVAIGSDSQPKRKQHRDFHITSGIESSEMAILVCDVFPVMMIFRHFFRLNVSFSVICFILAYFFSFFFHDLIFFGLFSHPTVVKTFRRIIVSLNDR